MLIEYVTKIGLSQLIEWFSTRLAPAEILGPNPMEAQKRHAPWVRGIALGNKPTIRGWLILYTDHLKVS